jgi:hypothetical protein
MKKINFVVLYILFTLLIGCIEESESSENKDSISTSAGLPLKVIENYFQEDLNTKIFEEANDTLINWKNKMTYWRGDTLLAESILDSLVCINNAKNKAIMVIKSRMLVNKWLFRSDHASDFGVMVPL